MGSSGYDDTPLAGLVAEACDHLDQALNVARPLYAELYFPTRLRPEALTVGAAPASRPPGPGDTAAQHAYGLMVRHVARAHEHLGRLNWEDPGRVWNPQPLLHVPWAHARLVTWTETETAVQRLTAMLADLVQAQAAGRLDVDAERVVRRACAEARAALVDAWDRPDDGGAGTSEAGTFVTPPSHWPGPNPRRCRRVVDEVSGERCGRIMGGRGGDVCQAHVQADYRARVRDAVVDADHGRRRR